MAGNAKKNRGKDALALGLIAAVWAAVTLGVLLVAGPRAGPGRPALAVFAPDRAPDAALAGIIAAGVQPLRPVLAGRVWLVRAGDAAFTDRLKAQGALAVLPTPPVGVIPAGCAGLVRAPTRPLPETVR